VHRYGAGELAAEKLSGVLRRVGAAERRLRGGAADDWSELLAGRKALRDFKQAPAYPKHPKSPLDPSMDSVFKTEAHGDGFSAPADAQQHSKLRLKPRETLDAISLIKRILGGSGVPSTREMGFRAIGRALSEEALGAYRALQDWQRELGIDDLSDLYYQEQFERWLHEQRQEGHEITPEEEAEIRRNASLLQGALSKARIPLEAASYYAILVADGDRMGAAIDALTKRGRAPRNSRGRSTSSPRTPSGLCATTTDTSSTAAGTMCWRCCLRTVRWLALANCAKRSSVACSP
jgi:hypothetical protein